MEMPQRKIGVIVQRLLTLRDGLVVFASIKVLQRPVHPENGVQGIQLVSALDLGETFFLVPDGGQVERVFIMRGRIVLVQIDRSQEFDIGCFPVVIIIKEHLGERRVRFGQSVVNLDRFHRRHARFSVRIGGERDAVKTQRVVGVRFAGIRRSVVWLNGDGLIVILDAFQQAFRTSLVPVIAPAEIGFVSLRAGCVLDCQPLPLGGRQL